MTRALNAAKSMVDSIFTPSQGARLNLPGERWGVVVGGGVGESGAYFGGSGIVAVMSMCGRFAVGDMSWARLTRSIR